MREQTSLPHQYSFVGRLWNDVLKNGNYDTSRSPIDTIIMHSMDGSMAGTLSHFQNPAVVPSAHYGIGFDGGLVQYLPENVTAYHCGNYAVNQRSIGMEHEDQGNNQGVRPDALYETSAKLLADLSVAYNIPLDRDHIKLHHEIIPTACPGTLDVDRIIARAKQLIQPAEEPLHNYQIKPSVFNAMVTKSSEYDALWEELKLDQSVKANPGSHQVILDNLQAQVTQARNVPANVPVAPALPATPSTPTAPATPAQPASPSPADQANAVPVATTSIWRKDIRDVLADVFNALRGDRAN